MEDQIDIQGLVQRSGNSFHSKVVAALKAKGWSTLISPYYNDSLTDKPREIDLLAEKAFPITHPFGDRRGAIAVRLFIECKYVPQATVFWFHDKDGARARQLVLATTPMRDNNAYTDKHHYLRSNPSVAKLFASETKRDAENEIMYKALNQSLNALLYFRRGKPIITELSGGTPDYRATVNYPVILCNSLSRFYRVDMETDAPPAQIETNFMLEVNYAYLDPNQTRKQEYFLIDVVEFGRLDDFLKCVQDDTDAMQVIVQ